MVDIPADCFDIDAARILRDSDSGMAVLVEAPELSDPVWIPKSLIHDDSEVFEVGHEGTILIASWFAEKKGWL